jgi:hypothetical protein
VTVTWPWKLRRATPMSNWCTDRSSSSLRFRHLLIECIAAILPCDVSAVDWQQ